MIQNIVTSIILYSGTAVDLLIILMLFFAKRKSRKDIINIYLGQFLGSVSLILLSLLFAFVLNYIPSKEILGLLGLIPIFLGLKVLLLGDSDGEAIAKEGLRKDNKNLIFLVAMITFASCGADNIGVFVPYFTIICLIMKSNYSVFTSLSRIVYNVKEKIASLDNNQTGCDVMKIEKINENQIRCTLTRADLEERHIRLSELAYGSENAKSLFRDMMQQANLEFGFEADNTPLMIEAIPVSADSIILIISKVDDPEELDTRFSKFTPLGNSGTSSEEAPPVEVEGADDILGIFQKIYEAKSRAMERKKKERNSEETTKETKKTEISEETPVSVNLMREYTFRNLDTVIEAAHGLNNFFQGFSALYKNEKDGTYSLILRQEKTLPEDFNKVCNILSEYGSGTSFSPAKQAYLEEHGGCMIPQNALTQLTKI